MLDNIDYLRIRYINVNAGTHGGHDDAAVKVLAMLFREAELVAINDVGANVAAFRGVGNAVGNNITVDSPLGRALARAAQYHPDHHAGDEIRANEITNILTPLVRRVRRNTMEAEEVAIWPNGSTTGDFTLDKNAASAVNLAWANLVQAAQDQFDALYINDEANIAARYQNVLNAIADIGVGVVIADADESAIYRALLEQKRDELQTAIQTARDQFDALNIDVEAHIATRCENVWRAMEAAAGTGLAGLALEHYGQLLMVKIAALDASMQLAQRAVEAFHLDDLENLEVRLQSIEAIIANIGYGVVIADAAERAHYLQLLQKEVAQTRANIELRDKKRGTSARLHYAHHQFEQNLTDVKATQEAIRMATEADHSAITDVEERAIYESLLGEARQSIEILANVDREVDKLSALIQELNAKAEAANKALEETSRKISVEAAGQQLSLGIARIGEARIAIFNLKNSLLDMALTILAKAKASFTNQSIGRSDEIDTQLSNIKSLDGLMLQNAQTAATAITQALSFEKAAEEAQIAAESSADAEKLIAEILASEKEADESIKAAQAKIIEVSPSAVSVAARESLGNVSHFMEQAQIALGNLQAAKAMADQAKADISKTTGIGLKWIKLNMESMMPTVQGETAKVKQQLARVNEHLNALLQDPTSAVVLMDQSASILGQQLNSLQSQIAQFAQGLDTEIPVVQPTMLHQQPIDDAAVSQRASVLENSSADRAQQSLAGPM